MPSVVYNSQTIPDIFGKFAWSHSYVGASLSCTFRVNAASFAALVTACDSIEAALRVRHKDLTVSFGGSAEYSYSHASNTGFLAEPKLSKINSKGTSGVNREYQFSVDVKLPANKAGYNYRQEGHVTLSEPIQSRRRLNISGTYTAGGSNSAYDNYETHGTAWADAIALTFGTYELMDSRADYEHEDKICRFSRSYQEKLTISVTYNGYTIPTSYNKFTFQETYESLSFSSEFALPISSCAAAEAALRIYNGDLTMTLGGAAHYSYKHSDNTGFLATPSLVMISDRDESDNRFYRFSLSCQLPANATGYNYRRSGSYSVRYAGSRRRVVSFQAVYTAGGADDAFDKYLAALGGETWAAGILSALGGTYEKISESVNLEHTEKIAKVSLVYQELLTNDTAAATNNDSIVNANCQYSAQFVHELGYSATASGFSPANLVSVSVSYSAEVDCDEESESALHSLYNSTVKPWLIEHSLTALGLSSYTGGGANYVTQNESYSVNPSQFRISGSITFMAHTTTEIITRMTERISTNYNRGIAHQKIWDGEDDTHNVYRTGGQTTRTRSITLEKYNAPPDEPTPLLDENNKKWVQLSLTRSEQVSRVGAGPVAQSYQQQPLLYRTTFSEQYLLVDPIYQEVI